MQGVEEGSNLPKGASALWKCCAFRGITSAKVHGREVRSHRGGQGPDPVSQRLSTKGDSVSLGTFGDVWRYFVDDRRRGALLEFVARDQGLP